jgi:sarcosine oxidase subunit beta
MERADVVVIGAGVTGLSSAFWLAKTGMDVLVVDKGIVGWEASGRNGGPVGPRGNEPPVVPLAAESCRLWPTMDEELGYPTEFVGKGRVAVALDEDH